MPGVMELLPLEQIAFQRMLDTIRRGYERFGFLPIETPVMEYRKVLLTKTGGETERQVYFVQSTGSLEQKREPELALRFDLTVPLARYVAEHEGRLVFPFRRYQMQRVYRGESAQKGRYREFYQCDVDVIGKNDLPLAFDAEIPTVIYHVFREIDVGKFTIHINNRKLLGGFFSNLGIGPDEQPLVLREVDKLDKVGPEKVAATLTGERFGLESAVVDRILEFIALGGQDNAQILDRLDALEIEDELFQQGLTELRHVVEGIAASAVPSEYVKINLAIARGLDYYTGTVYETQLDDHPEIGSVCSGGRYDNLAGHYTKSHLPGVGISIGATRLFYKLKEAGLVGAAKSTVTALVTRMSEDLGPEYLKLAAELRAAGINTEVVHAKSKFGKQMKYADNCGIRFAIILGEDEVAAGNVTVKDLSTGDQVTVARTAIAAEIRALQA